MPSLWWYSRLPSFRQRFFSLGLLSQQQEKLVQVTFGEAGLIADPLSPNYRALKIEYAPAPPRKIPPFAFLVSPSPIAFFLSLPLCLFFPSPSLVDIQGTTLGPRFFRRANTPSPRSSTRQSWRCWKLVTRVSLTSKMVKADTMYT